MSRAALARRALAVGGLAALAPALGRAPLCAQDTTQVVVDSAATPDSIPPGPGDSTAVPAAPARVLPLPPEETPPGPLPPGTRLVFTRDSIAWNPWYTLADLLGAIPGVYVARGGFLGQPEPVAFAGRGPTAIEVLWDGTPMLPIGPDSTALDPGRISLFPFRRVEVEVLPTSLRVYLVSERHETATTRSAVRIVSGDFETGGYAGLFQHRWPSGAGVTLAADFLGTEGAREPMRPASGLDLWGKVDWTPTPRTAASFQIRRHTYQRDPTGFENDVDLVPGREGKRTDVLMRVTSATRADRYGLWTQAGIATTAWSPDSASPDTLVTARTLHRVFAGVGARGRSTNLEVSAGIGDHYTTSEARGRLGWTPFTGAVLSAEGSMERHRGDRRSLRANLGAGLSLGPASLTGELAWQDAVAAPVVLADTAQRATDWAVRAGLRTRWLSGRVGLVERDAYQPLAFTGYPTAGVGPSGQTRSLELDAIVRLGAWSLDGWYANPIRGLAPDFEPPKHGRAALTFRSRFLRTFRRGSFDLKVQVAMESWSTGVAGRDEDGIPVPLIGATFYEGFIQFRIGGFLAFYSLKNAYNSREQFVPGLEYPRNIQTFGVKWTFTN